MQRGSSRNHFRTSVGLALAAWVAASASGARAAAVGEVYDPWEGLNRKLYVVNHYFDRIVLRPVIGAYLQLPKPIRSGFTNAAANIGEPITFVNNVLQVRPRAAGRTLTRFATNSTLGLAGTINLAERAGFPREYADFGQTLGRYGVGPGPYLFIPGLGPSNLRDFSSRFVDFTLDPVYYQRFKGDVVIAMARPTISALDTRIALDAELSAIDQTATDPYVTVRSAYLQNRQSFIRGGKVDVDNLPSFESAPAPVEEAPLPSTPPAE